MESAFSLWLPRQSPPLSPFAPPPPGTEPEMLGHGGEGLDKAPGGRAVWCFWGDGPGFLIWMTKHC